MRKSLWWIIATEPNGAMSYLKKECKCFFEAVNVMRQMEKDMPALRYQIVEIK